MQKKNFDLILTGVQAEDGGAQVGGMLAAMLDYPFASLVNSIEVLDGKKLKIGREIEGGAKEMSEIDMPCVLSIQTGINEPRYVGMRGIRQVASVEIPTFDAAGLGIDSGSVGEAGAKVKRDDYFVPTLGKGAEMLEGSSEEIIEKLIESAEGQSWRGHCNDGPDFRLASHIRAAWNHRRFGRRVAGWRPLKKIDACGCSHRRLLRWVGRGSRRSLRERCALFLFGEVWKLASESLAYPNAELIRKALVKVLPQGSVLLVPHNHFGIDLAPGLSIKLNAALCALM